MKIWMVSISDIKHLVKYTISVNCWHTQRSPPLWVYADDCDIVTHSEDEIQCLINHFVLVCKGFGLEISLKKTVVMHDLVPGLPYIEPAIYAKGKRLDVVHSLAYLGSTLTERFSFDKEISLCIEKASGSFLGLEKHGIKLETKVIVYKTCVLMSLLYTSEMWTMYKNQLRTLEHFHQRYRQQILCIGWQSHIPDTDVSEWAGLPSIESMVVKSCLRWGDYVIWMDDSHLPKKLFYSEMRKGKRKVSKQKKRFKDTKNLLKTIQHISRPMGKKWHWISGAIWLMWV